MAQAGDSSLWVSWDQPSVLRRARSPTACEGSCCPEARNLPSREWMFACGDPRRSQCRHHNGLYELQGSRILRKQRSEEHTSELQSPCNLVCRLLLEKKK